MQKIFDDLKQLLADFVSQRDVVTLVVGSADGHAPVIAKALEEVEDAGTSEMFWINTNDFVSAPDYVTAVVNGFAAKHSAVRMRTRSRPSKVASSPSPTRFRFRSGNLRRAATS